MHLSLLLCLRDHVENILYYKSLTTLMSNDLINLRYYNIIP